jgi:hypothetical protein
MEFILELIVTYLFSYPGAVVRWMLLKAFGSKKTFKECLKQDITQNAALGFLLLAILFVSISLFTA